MGLDKLSKMTLDRDHKYLKTVKQLEVRVMVLPHMLQLQLDLTMLIMEHTLEDMELLVGTQIAQFCSALGTNVSQSHKRQFQGYITDGSHHHTNQIHQKVSTIFSFENVLKINKYFVLGQIMIFGVIH